MCCGFGTVAEDTSESRFRRLGRTRIPDSGVAVADRCYDSNQVNFVLGALACWAKWQQLKRTHEKDLGDGGIQTLFGSNSDKSSPPR
jgi:hypothetical protein